VYVTVTSVPWLPCARTSKLYAQPVPSLPPVSTQTTQLYKLQQLRPGLGCGNDRIQSHVTADAQDATSSRTARTPHRNPSSPAVLVLLGPFPASLTERSVSASTTQLVGTSSPLDCGADLPGERPNPNNEKPPPAPDWEVSARSGNSRAGASGALLRDACCIVEYSVWSTEVSEYKVGISIR
jgi:hypothetical protein